MSHIQSAGMGKRVYGGDGDDYSRGMRRSGAVRGGTKSGYSFVPGGTQMGFDYPNPYRSSSYAGPKRYRSNRFYQGRGVRSGTAQLRRFRGLRRYPQAGIETKFFDASLANSALVAFPASATWAGLEQNPATLNCLNCPTQGTGASNREGRYITMESLQIQGVLNIPQQTDQTGTDIIPVLKIWIVMDKQTNGGSGTSPGLDSENVYTNPSALAACGSEPLRNMLFSKRYKVLKEITIEPKTLPIANDSAAMTSIEQEGLITSFACFINLKGKKVEFSANAGTVADIVDNGLFVLAGTTGTSTAPAISYNSRLRFRG